MSTEPQDLHAAGTLPKFSRYRSVRSSANAPNHNPTQVLDGRNVVQDGGLKKSPSRYRRAPGKSPFDHADIPTIPFAPRSVTLPIGFPPSEENRKDSRFVERSENLPHKSEPPTGDTRNKRAQRSDLGRRAPLEELEAEFKAQGRRHAEALETAREVGRDEAKRVRGGEGMQRAATVPFALQISDEEAAEILEIQKRKDLERLERELDAAGASSPKSESPPKERFHLFSRKRVVSKDLPPSSTPTSRSTSSNDMPEPKKQLTILGKSQPIEVGGGGIVPGTDAPVSAVNSGERRVLLRCMASSINLPVTPTTTATDIIYSAANVLNQKIDPTKAVLLESYARLSLERGIRRYEHIRDVMNSWDRDTQNALLLEPTSTSFRTSHPFSNLASLDSGYVSQEAPTDVSVYLYHSQKPGKWNKRHVTLLSSGQIYISKNRDAKISDKDSHNICHLSDFDIFVPTSSQVRKNLKPPKKICYTIKSQQKSNFFESTENFVHFFCTNDENLAKEWWDAVQKWRSWYLLHKRGRNNKEIDVAPEDTAEEVTAKDKKQIPNTRAGENNGTTYTSGPLEQLLGTADFSGAGRTRRNRTVNPPNDSSYDTNEEDDGTPFLNYKNGTPHKSSKRSKYPPVSSGMSKIRSNNSSSADESYGNSSGTGEDKTFAPTGLLGRTYTVRQKELKEKEKAEKNSGPFTEGHSLLNTAPISGNVGLSRRTSTRRPSIDATRSADERGERPKTSDIATNIHRSNTMRTTHRPNTASERTHTMTGGNGNGRIPPVPLVDLTPKVLEAKQWSKEGKGHGVKAPEGTLLVEAAKSRELDDFWEGNGGVRKVVVPKGYEPRIGGRVLGRAVG